MMEELNKNERQTSNFRDDEVLSIPVRAGKRTYFFDLKKTKTDNYYLIITESQRKFDESQLKNTFQKHKIYIYKDNLLNFAKAFEAIMEYAKENIDLEEKRYPNEVNAEVTANLSDDEFLKDMGFEDNSV